MSLNYTSVFRWRGIRSTSGQARLHALPSRPGPGVLAHYGPKNFLWFSDIALLTTGGALWLESPLLASMMSWRCLLPESLEPRFLRPAAPGHPIRHERLHVRRGTPRFSARSPFSIHRCPPGSLWLVGRLGYDRRAWLYQSLLAWSCCR